MAILQVVKVFKVCVLDIKMSFLVIYIYIYIYIYISAIAQVNRSKCQVHLALADFSCLAWTF